MQNLMQIVTRLIISIIFIGSGYGKFQNLDGVVAFFTSLGIPAPQLQAPFVAATELGCGVLILIGLATRLASLPLIGTMVVAIYTAKWVDVTGLTEFLDLSEFLYIVLLGWLVATGAGCWSVDHYLKKNSTGFIKKISKCF